MSELAQLLSTLEVATTGPRPCVLVRRAKEELDAEAADTMLRLVEEKVVSVLRIHGALRGAGFGVAKESISDHRNGFCTCGMPSE